MKPILITVVAALLTTGAVANRSESTPPPAEPVQEQTIVVEEESKIETVEAEPVQEEVAIQNIVTWEDNPNNCDTDTQWIAAEEPFKCIDKPVSKPAPTASAEPSLGWCNHAHLGGRTWDVNTAIAVCKCESGGNASAKNTSGRDYSIGLFQINLYGYLAYTRPSEGWLLNPHNNVEWAYKMWKEQGWSPWTCIHKI